MEAIIVDIDGTLADLGHRLHHIAGGAKNWTAFFDAMPDDGCVEPIRRLCSMAYAELPVVICSGRPDSHRSITEKWLYDHGVPYSALYMRAAGDHRPDDIVKSQILDAILADGYEPLFVVDDRPRVVAMWRDRGLVCLQCREWDDDAAVPAPATTLTIMVGPSGAGKTHWLRTEGEKDNGIVRPSQILSSDEFRHCICGDYRDQTKNAAVFAALHDVAKTRLRHGVPTVIDATNLRRKDRLACVDLAPPGTRVRYIVVDRPMEEKRRDAGWRAALPIDLLAKHDQIFRSQITDILAGDGRAGIEVIDVRVER